MEIWLRSSLSGRMYKCVHQLSTSETLTNQLIVGPAVVAGVASVEEMESLELETAAFTLVGFKASCVHVSVLP